MIVRDRTVIWRALLSDWPALLYFLALALGAEFIYEYTRLAHTALPLLPLSVLITAMSIFLGFQINQCYERWWEARRLWGQLVNASRSFGRQATTLLTAGRIAAIADEAQAAVLQRELVYRQIAYANALRITLRSGGGLSEQDWQFLGQWLGEEEIARLRQARNVPTQLIQRQGERLAAVMGKDWAEQQILLQLNDSLNRTYEIQGGCERIKRTAFPDRFRFHTHIFVWLVATLIPFSLIETDQRFDAIAIVTETLLAFVFVTIERLGSELRDPFENQPNDTPMSALCRTIEIELRQQLGEAEVPPPLQPVDGVLM
ncbi:MAG TPA: bestrophin family ion channel [Methylococcaceae bacterium]|nr:bestrophin family ion channel [Methylococcaceae bacterium]